MRRPGRLLILGCDGVVMDANNDHCFRFRLLALPRIACCSRYYVSKLQLQSSCLHVAASQIKSDTSMHAQGNCIEIVYYVRV